MHCRYVAKQPDMILSPFSITIKCDSLCKVSFFRKKHLLHETTVYYSNDNKKIPMKKFLSPWMIWIMTVAVSCTIHVSLSLKFNLYLCQGKYGQPWVYHSGTIVICQQLHQPNFKTEFTSQTLLKKTMKLNSLNLIRCLVNLGSNLDPKNLLKLDLYKLYRLYVFLHFVK